MEAYADFLIIITSGFDVDCLIARVFSFRINTHLSLSALDSGCGLWFLSVGK